MPGCCTAHSRIKIPIKLENGSFCRITKQSNLAALLRETEIIIWDEAPMANRLAMEALDRSLQDIVNNFWWESDCLWRGLSTGSPRCEERLATRDCKRFIVEIRAMDTHQGLHA